MRDAEQVRRFVRAEHADLIGTAVLLTGDRSSADDLVEAATYRVLRRAGAARLTAVAVRDEMTRLADAGRVPGGQVIDAAPPADPDRIADAVLARRRRRRLTAALLAAAVVGVPLALAVSDRPELPEPTPTTAETPTEPAPPRRVDVVTGSVRGSLAADEDFLAAARGVDWGTDHDPPSASRRVVYADDTVAGRVALVAAETGAGLDGAWLLGPRGAPAGQLTAFVPERIGRTRPAAVLVDGADATAIVVVTAPGDAVEFSPHLRSDPSGSLMRPWTAVPVDDGIAVIEVADVTAGRAAAVRVVRDGAVAARPVVREPRADAGNLEPVDLEPMRPGTAEADPALVAEATAAVGRPFGVDRDALSPDLMWSGELTHTGGLGHVVVLTARVPGNAHVVTALGRVGAARSGLPVPCGTTSFPAEVPPSVLSLALTCSISDRPDYGADRTWLIVTAPLEAAEAEVLDEGGSLLDTLSLDRGSSMSRTPDGAAQVRVAYEDGRTLDVIPIAPAPEAPFGDYGDG